MLAAGDLHLKRPGRHVLRPIGHHHYPPWSSQRDLLLPSMKAIEPSDALCRPKRVQLTGIIGFCQLARPWTDGQIGPQSLRATTLRRIGKPPSCSQDDGAAIFSLKRCTSLPDATRRCIQNALWVALLPPQNPCPPVLPVSNAQSMVSKVMLPQFPDHNRYLYDAMPDLLKIDRSKGVC